MLLLLLSEQVVEVSSSETSAEAVGAAFRTVVTTSSYAALA